jgi:hypothetical protein
MAEDERLRVWAFALLHQKVNGNAVDLGLEMIVAIDLCGLRGQSKSFRPVIGDFAQIGALTP